MTFDPDWVVRPGLILLEEMEEREITVWTVAEGCGVGLEVIEAVIDGDEPITEQLANGLVGLGFGASPRLWMNLERHYRDGLAAGKVDISDQ